MSEVIVNEGNFESEVLKSEIPVIVDFWAEWCGPCKVIGPVLTELSHEYEGKLKVAKLNVDENAALTQQYGVLSIPTMKFFRHGQIVGEIVGAAPKTTIVGEIQKHL